MKIRSSRSKTGSKATDKTDPTSNVRVLNTLEEAVAASVAAREDFLARVAFASHDGWYVQARKWWPLAAATPLYDNNPPVVG